MDEGGWRRIALAEQVVPDFGIGFFCGLGGTSSNMLLEPRPTPSDTRELGDLLDLHCALTER